MRFLFRPPLFIKHFVPHRRWWDNGNGFWVLDNTPFKKEGETFCRSSSLLECLIPVNQFINCIPTHLFLILMTPS